MSETMTAGIDLDALVAEKVMGWSYQRSKHGHWKVTAPDGTMHEPMYGVGRYDSYTGELIDYHWSSGIELPAYSTDIAAAFLVMERMRDLKFWPKLEWVEGWDRVPKWHASFHRGNGMIDHLDAEAPAAICHAALKTLAHDWP